MRTRTFKLTGSEEQALQVAYLHCQAGATRTRYQAVRLYGMGYSVAEVLQICGCSLRSLLEWCQRYRAEGITGLVDHRIGGNRRRLQALEIEELSQLMHQFTPGQLLGPAATGDGVHWCVGDLRQVVSNRFGVVYQSQTSYRTLLKRCSFSYQRAMKQYQSRNERKVMDFEEALEKNSSTSPKSVLTRPFSPVTKPPSISKPR
jgi:transposase